MADPEHVHHYHEVPTSTADHARELGDVVVVASVVWIVIGAPYAGELGMPQLQGRSEPVTIGLFAGGVVLLLLEWASQWLVEARQPGASWLVSLPSKAVLRLISATRLAVGLGAAGAAGALGAKLVLGANLS